MMYQNKFVAVVKSRGKILRERDVGVVYLPFGEEYSLLLKNLNSQKALVKVSIDGEDVLGGNELIVRPNSNVELERFIKNSLNRGNRFKFIQKTQQIEEHRGNRIDDGIIRITYQFEKPSNNWTYITSTWDYDSTPYGISWSVESSNMEDSSFAVQAAATSSQATEIDCNEGITVPGSISNQKFYHGNIGELEVEEHVIILRLVGEVKNQKVQSPLAVQRKLVCDTCGKLNKNTHKYCIECGTFLTII